MVFALGAFFLQVWDCVNSLHVLVVVYRLLHHLLSEEGLSLRHILAFNFILVALHHYLSRMTHIFCVPKFLLISDKEPVKL